MKRLPRRALALGLALLATAAVTATTTTSLRAQSTSADAATIDPRSIVDTAITSGQTNTLVALVQAADLVDALNGDGPFTVFAPTDAAFAKLPQETRNALLQPENKELLQQVLLYHVVPGKVLANQIQPRQGAETLQGQGVRLTRSGARVTVDGINVVAADIECTNGVIHLIDEVLLPTPPQTRAQAHARRMVQTAIAHGVPMFNHGNAAGCAAIYSVAAHGLMAADPAAMPQSARMSVANALNEAMQNPHDANARAWALRRGLDDALAAMPAMARGDSRLDRLAAFGLPTGSNH